MAETKKIESEAPQERPATFITFYQPYVFEGKTYDGIDIAPIYELTGRDLMDLDAYFRRRGVVLQAPEWNAEYIFALAARACSLPLEFFEQLPAVSAALVRATVQAAFLGRMA